MQKIGDNIYVLITLGIAGSIILSGAVVYFVAAYIKKEARQKEYLKQKEIEHQANLFTAIIQSQQEEQRKIGREIHDEAGTLLSSIKLRLSGGLMDGSENRLLIQSIADIDKLSGMIRNISHLLLPPEIEHLGFHEAVESLCHSFSGTNQISITLQDDVPGFIPQKNYQLSLSLYRIIQELINNTIKHAGASSISIQFTNESGSFVIRYSDNGKGLNTKSEFTGGIGMQNIQSRILMMHATSKIESGESKGFHFFLYLKHENIF